MNLREQLNNIFNDKINRTVREIIAPQPHFFIQFHAILKTFAIYSFSVYYINLSLKIKMNQIA